MNNIIISPKYEKLIKEVKQLRTKLSELVLELDNLKFVICKEIEMKYMLELDDLEYKVLKAEMEYRRNKRKLELIQAKLNRQEFVDITAINKQLDIEFVSFNQQLEEMWKQLDEAMYRRNCRSLSIAESKELKILYRLIVKKFHPDMNPDVSEKQLQLFQNAVVAYRNGDILAMRLICRLIEDENFEDELLSVDEYEYRIVELKDNIIACEDEIDHVKNVYPYIMKELLKNSAEVSKKRDEYKIQLKEFEGHNSRIINRIQELTSNKGGVLCLS